MNRAQLASKLGKSLSDNAPTILTGLAVAGTITTAVFAVKATPQALEDIHQYKVKREYLRDEQLAPSDAVRVAWRNYIPAGLMGAATIAAIIGSNTVSTKRASALAAAYSLTDTAYKEYREKVVETFGKDKEEGVRSAVLQDRVDKQFENKEVTISGEGEQLFIDVFTGRHFMSSVEKVRSVVNDVNYQVNNQGYASLNDLHVPLGLASTTVGEELGWTSDRLLDIYFTPILAAGTKPCIGVEFHTEPKRNYHRIF